MGHLQSSLLPAYAKITRDELTELVSNLNKRCDECFAESSVKLFFAVKGLDGKAFLWKKSVEIVCFTMRAGNTYSKSYHLFDFLRFYHSLLPILEGAEAASSSPSGEQQAGDLATNEQLMQMSVFQEESCTCEGKCIICFEDRPNLVLSCMHAYCEKCVAAFRGANQTTCPLCRHKIERGGTDKECWVVEEKPEKELMCAYMVGDDGSSGSNGASTSAAAAAAVAVKNEE